MTNRKNYFIIAKLSFLAFGLFSTGCGNSAVERHEVTGVISHQGRPLTMGTVRFVPTKGQPSLPIPIGSDGKFKTELPEGDYRVEVKATDSPAGQNAQGQSRQLGFEDEGFQAGPPPKWLIPQKYGRFNTSGLTASIEAKTTNTVDLNLR